MPAIRLRVGPESAGSVPGPACYGNGGQAATVTDANVVLGYLDAAAFMGGQRPLDRAASEAAIDRVATALELSRQQAAAGIYRMINLKMADGIRLMTLRRGVDPRKFALLSFGGAAGLHAAEVARELEIKRIIVPTVASVLSAWGMLTSDLRYEVSRTHYGEGPRITASEVRALFAELEQQAAGRLRSWFDGPIAIERSAEMRYGEQIFEIDVSLDGLDWNAENLVDQIEDRFHVKHEELYTYASRGQEVVFVNARVAAVGEVAQRGQDARPASSSGTCAPRGQRQAFFGGWRDVPVYALDDLKPGHTLGGAGDHRGRDHDGAGRHRRPRDGEPARVAGYYVAVTRRMGGAKRTHHRHTACSNGGYRCAPPILRAKGQSTPTFDFNIRIFGAIFGPAGLGVTRSC